MVVARSVRLRIVNWRGLKLRLRLLLNFADQLIHLGIRHLPERFQNLIHFRQGERELNGVEVHGLMRFVYFLFVAICDLIRRPCNR